MKYTFAEAQRKLRSYAGGSPDPAEAVNVALEALTSSRRWLDRTCLVRLTTANEYFALPQEYMGIERAAVNGTPVSMKSSDYEFLHGGPGDLDEVPEGYVLIQSGIQDLGVFPTMYAPDRAEHICAFSTAETSGVVRVRGRNKEGDLVTETVAVNTWDGQDSIGDQDASAVSKTATTFAIINELTIPSDASAYISIYGISDTAFYFLSRMHPDHRAADFRRYRLPMFNNNVDGESHSILAETRMQFLPLVDDDDIVPFDTLLPIQYMMQSLNYANAQEVDEAVKYRSLAISFLSEKEETRHTTQGITIVNPLYDLSAGQASNDFYDNM